MIDKILSPFADAFAVIKNAAYQSDRLGDEVNGLFRWLNRIDNADRIPPAILYLSRNLHSPTALVRFFTDLERLAAGLMIRRANINERYGRLLTAIEDEADLYADDSPLQLSYHERNDILRILNGDLYLMEKIRLYVLLRLDTEFSEGEATYRVPIISVEHVLPQKPNSDSIWLKWFPLQQDIETCVHHLGNLVLLSRRKNSQAKNYEFDQKKQRYFAGGKGTSSFALTTQVLSEEE